jgi:PAP_fibrillin
MRSIVVTLATTAGWLSTRSRCCYAFLSVPVVTPSNRYSQDNLFVLNVMLYSSPVGEEVYKEEFVNGVEQSTAPSSLSTMSTTTTTKNTTSSGALVDSEAPTPNGPIDVGAKEKYTVEEAKTFILSVGAISGRGEYAKKIQKESVLTSIAVLEKNNPSPDPCSSEAILGTWELVYSSTELFRSSPFFLAGRAVCTTEDERNRFDWFCTMHRQALAISNIGSVRQVISGTTLTSEFEVKVGSIPFLSDLTPFRYSGGIPLTVDGAIVSTADLTPSASGTDSWDMYMDTVEIKGSNIPGLRQLLDQGLKLQSRLLADFLEQQVPDSIWNYKTPRPKFRVTYLDDRMRVSRDQDENAFVYVKTSTSCDPTEYKSVESDLGLLSLLEGLNDAVTKIYI